MISRLPKVEAFKPGLSFQSFFYRQAHVGFRFELGWALHGTYKAQTNFFLIFFNLRLSSGMFHLSTLQYKPVKAPTKMLKLTESLEPPRIPVNIIIPLNRGSGEDYWVGNVSFDNLIFWKKSQLQKKSNIFFMNKKHRLVEQRKPGAHTINLSSTPQGSYLILLLLSWS